MKEVEKLQIQTPADIQSCGRKSRKEEEPSQSKLDSVIKSWLSLNKIILNTIFLFC